MGSSGRPEQRIERDGYVVIVVAEGAGQNLLAETAEWDASGNRRHGDIGAFLRDKIPEMFRAQGISLSLKYIDPSYMIRSLPANARDANFCLRLGHAAVHAGMAGKTDVVIGSWRRRLTHVPIPTAVSSRKRVDTNGYLWQTVLSVTGQADDLLSALVSIRTPPDLGMPVTARNVPPWGMPAPVASARMAMYDTCTAQPNVVVLGGGSWGTTVASICARRGPTLQWVRSEETANDINENHRNSKYLGKRSNSRRR